jgi:DNA-directed RNA polymerase specialized sigma24 family protein
MQHGGKESQFSEILAQLKKLPEDDRIYFSLQLYEGLTSQQAEEVLHLNSQNHSNPKKGHKQYRRSTAKSL